MIDVKLPFKFKEGITCVGIVDCYNFVQGKLRILYFIKVKQDFIKQNINGYIIVKVISIHLSCISEEQEEEMLHKICYLLQQLKSEEQFWAGGQLALVNILQQFALLSFPPDFC